jgi:Pentapeptide repeats (8 copies)
MMRASWITRLPTIIRIAPSGQRYHRPVWGDSKGGGDGIFERIGRLEDLADDGKYPWLGLGPGLALGIVLALIGVVGAPLVWVVPFYTGSRLAARLVGLCWLSFAGFAMVYWRRQRLAAHFEAAHRRLASADPDERQRALVDLMVNARRGRAEHGRIASDLAGYLRRPPLGDPGEPGRRQIAFTVLADQTLEMAAKKRLDLSGALLAGIGGVNAELPTVCLHGTDLSRANLAYANLEGADLSGARLEGANLSGARLAGAILPPRINESASSQT